MKDESQIGYLHGFTEKEQARLFEQARFHEEKLFSRVDFSACRNLLEVGSGVGAQTQILLERYPQASIQCVDAAPAQVSRAREALKKSVECGRVKIDQADASQLPYPDHSFDGAFLCWFLEHVQNPQTILAEVKRVLKPGGVIYCNEVFNSAYYSHPQGPNEKRFWTEYNLQQSALGGDPDVGPKLGNLLASAGFGTVTLDLLQHHYDDRSPHEREKFALYWADLLESAAPSLLESKRISLEVLEGMRGEMKTVGRRQGSVIFLASVLARAEA